MIYRVLNIIKTYLEERLGEDVILSSLSNESEAKGEGVVITLLHIQEEHSVKSQLPMACCSNDKKKNPEVLINLYILISAQDEKYSTALQNISSVIAAFQANNVLPVTKGGGTNVQDTETYKLSLHSMTLEQNLSMWQNFGDKMMPSVVYKVSVLKIQASEEVSPATIERIGISYDRKVESGVSSDTGEDIVFTKDASDSSIRILNDKERAKNKINI